MGKEKTHINVVVIGTSVQPVPAARLQFGVGILSLPTVMLMTLIARKVGARAFTLFPLFCGLCTHYRFPRIALSPGFSTEHNFFR